MHVPVQKQSPPNTEIDFPRKGLPPSLDLPISVLRGRHHDLLFLLFPFRNSMPVAA